MGFGPLPSRWCYTHIFMLLHSALLLAAVVGENDRHLLCRFVEPDQGHNLVDGILLNWWMGPFRKTSPIAKALRSGMQSVLPVLPRPTNFNCPMGTKRSSGTVAPLYRPVSPVDSVGKSTGAGSRDPYSRRGDKRHGWPVGSSHRRHLRSRAGRRTIIVISHHRSKISFCDDVVILGAGRVANQAPFAESPPRAWVSSTSTKRTKRALLYAIVLQLRDAGFVAGRPGVLRF